LLTVGQHVQGTVHAEVRLRRMQNHGAEHIISGLIHSLYGIENAGFHMSRDEFTIDTAAPLTEEMVQRVERLANEAVWANCPIRCYYPEEDALASLEYRSKTELSGKIRIVEIEGYDRCACCAPHLAFTGQIGGIRIKGFIKYKKGSRMRVAAGADAFEYDKALADNATVIAERYSVRSEEIARAVEERETVFEGKLRELRDLRERLLTLRLESIRPTEKAICLFEEGCDSGLLRKLVNEGVTRTNGLFAACSENGKGGYSYVVGIREGELAPLAAQMREALGGRGGGKGTMITGFVEASREEILRFFTTLE
ncbi:MAG: hypothetical protein IJX13_00205, partial [Clostridia bacterium]|nr:hypothetical protein [Clostridia bacterium]